MNSNTKKIIAREILLLFGCVISVLIICLLIYPCNYYCNTKFYEIDKLVTLKTSQIDSLFENSFMDLRDDYEKECKKFNYNNTCGIYNRSFKEYVKEYVMLNFVCLINDSGDYLINDSGPNHITWLKINAINNEKYKLQTEQSKWKEWEHITSYNMYDLKKLAIYLFFIFLIIIYPLRLLVWSINTIKHKGD